MRAQSSSKLNPKKRYLQVALNSTLAEASKIISSLPKSDRIIVEVGTPMIKRYGEDGIRRVRDLYAQRLYGLPAASSQRTSLSLLSLITNAARSSAMKAPPAPAGNEELYPYIVAD